MVKPQRPAVPAASTGEGEPKERTRPKKVDMVMLSKAQRHLIEREAARVGLRVRDWCRVAALELPEVRQRYKPEPPLLPEKAGHIDCPLTEEEFSAVKAAARSIPVSAWLRDRLLERLEWDQEGDTEFQNRPRKGRKRKADQGRPKKTAR